MKAELLHRLFKAIKRGEQDDLLKLAKVILEQERRQGHSKLVTELEELLKQDSSTTQTKSKGLPSGAGALARLPMSRRSGLLLATLQPYEELRHHMVLPESVEVRFRRIEREFGQRERLAMYGLKPRKKVLLYGPPGCGKSLGAERLAWQLGLPLMKVRFDIVMSSYLGESASNLREVFEASKETPRLLLLDECDAIAKARERSNDVGEVGRVVNTLLGLLDEYKAPGLLVATTNLSKALDTALFRRFDEVFEIPPPGQNELELLLKQSLSAMKVDPAVDWPSLAMQLKGVSAAFAVQIAEEAAKECVLSGENTVTMRRLELTLKEHNRSKE